MLLLIALSFLVHLSLALPAWNLPEYAAINSGVVPRTFYIEGIRPFRSGGTQFFGSSQFGVAGNLTIAPTREPSMFLHQQQQLFQVVNHTTLFQVNVLNATNVLDTTYHPVQIVSGTQRRGLKGSWSWVGSRLQYHMGKNTNRGLFYDCGQLGLFMFLATVPTPPGCGIVTLYSFTRDTRA